MKAAACLSVCSIGHKVEIVQNAMDMKIGESLRLPSRRNL